MGGGIKLSDPGPPPCHGGPAQRSFEHLMGLEIEGIGGFEATDTGATGFVLDLRKPIFAGESLNNLKREQIRDNPGVATSLI